MVTVLCLAIKWWSFESQTWLMQHGWDFAIAGRTKLQTPMFCPLNRNPFFRSRKKKCPSKTLETPLVTSLPSLTEYFVWVQLSFGSGWISASDIFPKFRNKIILWVTEAVGWLFQKSSSYVAGVAASLQNVTLNDFFKEGRQLWTISQWMGNKSPTKKVSSNAGVHFSSLMSILSSETGLARWSNRSHCFSTVSRISLQWHDSWQWLATFGSWRFLFTLITSTCLWMWR